MNMSHSTNTDILARVHRLEQQADFVVSRRSAALLNLRAFIENLQIVNKQGELARLIMNRSQEIVFEKLMECREERRPARFICLKARQMGISTLVEAFIFALITRYPNRFALVAAHSMETAGAVFSMARRFYQGLPRQQRPHLARNSVRRIEYAAPHSSRMEIDSASNRHLGRGVTIHYVHAGEVAFWERPEEPILAINQAVPHTWDTLIFWESTANGAHNLFHRAWVRAQRGDGDMEPIFLSWKGFPEYSLPVIGREPPSSDPLEVAFTQDHALTPGQARWACRVKKNQCHDSWEKFHQEYPVADYLAFAFTGMPWFDQRALQQFLDAPDAPIPARGRMEFVAVTRRTPQFVEDGQGPLLVWRCPSPAHSYSLGMDTGEGVGGDYTVIQVLCNETGELVATYRSNRVRAEMAGVDAYLLGVHYNHGLLGIERNGPGLAVLAACERGLGGFPWMTGYPNLYYHTFTDRKIPQETSRLGWITNRATKEAMLGRLAEAIQNRSLVLHDRTTLLQMQGFVWDAERRRFRQNYRMPGERLSHDDEIMALAIANEMRSRTWETRFIRVTLPQGGEF